MRRFPTMTLTTAASESRKLATTPAILRGAHSLGPVNISYSDAKFDLMDLDIRRLRVLREVALGPGGVPRGRLCPRGWRCAPPGGQSGCRGAVTASNVTPALK
jgi:hypothetical protein